MKQRMDLTAAMAGALMLLGGCGGSSSSQIDDEVESAAGTLTVAITDAPVDDVAEVWVQFSGVRVNPTDGPAIEFTFDEPMNIDLLTLTGESSNTLLNGVSVPAGEYEWIALDVNAEFDSTLDSYVVDEAGGTVELRVPSGSEQGLRLVSGFTVVAGGNTSFMIDWDLRKGLTNPVGQQGYFLRPALRITDLAEFGTIGGTVADALVMDDSCSNNLAEDRGNVVYVYEGADAATADIDGADSDPITTASVAQDDQAAGAYTYAAAFMPPGDYTVAFTCQGLDDDPDATDDLTFVGVQNVTVVTDEEAEADFL